MNIFDNTNLTTEERREIQGIIDIVCGGNQETEGVVIKAFQDDPNLLYKMRDILVAKKLAVQSGSKKDFDRIIKEEEILLDSLVA